MPHKQKYLNSLAKKSQDSGYSFSKTANVIFDLSLSSKAIVVGAYLISQGETFNPSQRFIAKKLRIDKTTVKKALVELQERGVITISSSYNKDFYSINEVGRWQGVTEKTSMGDRDSPPLLGSELSLIQEEQEDKGKSFYMSIVDVDYTNHAIFQNKVAVK